MMAALLQDNDLTVTLSSFGPQLDVPCKSSTLGPHACTSDSKKPSEACMLCMIRTCLIRLMCPTDFAPGSIKFLMACRMLCQAGPSRAQHTCTGHSHLADRAPFNTHSRWANNLPTTAYRSRRTSRRKSKLIAMAQAGQKTVLVPIGTGSEELETVGELPLAYNLH